MTMAACNLGSMSKLKICNFQMSSSNNLCTPSVIPCKVRCDKVESLCAIKGVHIGQKLTPKLVRCISEEIEVENANSEESASTKEQIVPVSGSFKVESLLTTICDTTSIAEVELKIGGFRLHVKRDMADNNISSSPPPPTPIAEAPPTNTSHQESASHVSDSASSLALDKPEPASRGIRDILETAADEGLVILKSPKVGLFRTSRAIKGKRTPPACKEKQEIKESQVLCYVEQLGGEMPIESEVSGEVIKILRKDGEPIGYGDALIAILPSFPGIKKLQKTGN